MTAMQKTRDLANDAGVPVVSEVNRLAGSGRRIVFVSGNFNIVHPGHLRLLQFAADCGDFLVVGVNPDSTPGVTVPAAMRLEGVRAIGIVDHAFLLEEKPEEFIRKLRPAVVVKGKEFEDRNHNPEQAAVESYGGRLLFGSGDVRFSSLDLLSKELRQLDYSTIRKPVDFPERHRFSFDDLTRVVRSFSGLRVAVIGDLIIDEYITCDPLGMSREDPTIVVTPIQHDRFVGGAGIVAAHAKGLGAEVRYISVVGQDSTFRYAGEMLERFGVNAEFIVDESRPTTLKQRYRCHGKTLLRVSHLRQHDVSRDLADRMYEVANAAFRKCDLVLFADFNYGCLPQSLVDRLSARGTELGVMMAADSQASSQISDISRFKRMRLLTPTEHEARLAVRDFGSGLVVLAEKLSALSQAENVFITINSEGLFVHAPNAPDRDLVTDQLPAFNTSPKDASGAGDSLFTCSSMALAVGANVWQSAYLGSLAAACQVGRVGNTPLSSDDLISELRL